MFRYSDSASGSLSVDGLRIIEVADDFLRRQRAGESPTIAEYEQAYPDLAVRIREVLTSMDMLRASVPKSDPLPEQIAGCRILRQVGTGAMGTVYEAEHPTVSRRLAIKVLHSGRAKRSFLREAELSSRLLHPGIVPFVDCGTEEDITYLSMHYIDGVSLDKLLNDYREDQAQPWIDAPEPGPHAPLDPTDSFATTVIGKDFRRIAELGAVVASALSYAHSEDVIHRDIKPGNLILDRYGKIWVTDFGLATSNVDVSGVESHSRVGTPSYMAPEQIEGVCSPQSDIYALGLTLYELACGKRPWGPTDSKALVAQRRTLEVPDLTTVCPTVPPEFARIIMKACALDSADRYPSAAELHNVLQRFADTGKRGDRRTRKRHENQRYIRRRPIWIAASVALTALVAVGGWSLYKTYVASDPLAVATAMQTEKFRTRFWDVFPEEIGTDSARDRETRRQIAGSLLTVLHQLDLGDSAQEKSLRTVVGNALSDYADGKVTKNMLREVRFGVPNHDVFLTTRLRLLGEDVSGSAISQIEKRVALAQLQMLRKQCFEGQMGDDVADQLRALLPKLDQRIGAEATDSLRHCLIQIDAIVTEAERQKAAGVTSGTSTEAQRSE